MQAEPQKEHRWLKNFVGDWRCEMVATMVPGEPPLTSTGEESVRMLGDLWAVCDGVGQMPDGGTMLSIITLGYDPAKEKFVGSFIGSVMTGMWIYEGELDEAANVLSMYAEGPSFTDPEKTGLYRDTFEIKDENHRVMTSSFQNEDGTWHQFMTMNYYRTK